MKSGFAQHSEQINNEAREWFSLMQSGSVTEQERQQLVLWLEASDEHRDAYRQLEVIWDDLATLSTSPAAALLKRSVNTGFFVDIKVSVQRFFTASFAGLRPQMALTLVAIMLVAGVVYLSRPALVPVDIYATKIGEIKTITLDDGSQVTLGARSTIKAWSDDSERHVVLESGQAFFVVSKDPQRPFWVDAHDTRVKVVGTQFDVRSNQDNIRVAVLEGVVNVSGLPQADYQADTMAQPVVLTAGQQVVKPRRDEFQPVKAVSEVELTAWRQGRLFYRNADLIDVIGDANRYFSGTISLEAQDLAALKVTVALRTDRVEFLPDMLSQTLPITVHKKSGNRIVISAKDKE